MQKIDFEKHYHGKIIQRKKKPGKSNLFRWSLTKKRREDRANFPVGKLVLVVKSSVVNDHE